MAPGALIRQSGPTAILILYTLVDSAAAGVLPPQQRIQQSQRAQQGPEALQLTQMHVDAIITAAPSPEHPPLLPAPALISPPASTTIPYRLLNVVPWPQPTGYTAPLRGAAAAGTAIHQLLRRNYNTVCGYISGDPDLPATCSSGSHCVLDTEHSVVGCCPDNSASCTAGVYTGCADGDSTQTEVNPYIYTCAAGSVCYKNEFSGGYYQYGCGSASEMGATVAMSATGLTSHLDLSSIQVTFTGTVELSASSTSSVSSATSRSSKPSVSSSAPPPSATSSYFPKPSSSFGSSTSSSSTSTSSAVLSTSASSEVPSRKSRDRAGVIIGATISSIAGLVAISALVIFFCWKRRKGDFRNSSGPRGGGPGYLSPASGNFQALHGTAEDFETGLRPEMIQADSATPGQPSYYSRWPMPDDVLENEAWVTPAIGPAASAAIAAGIGDRRTATPYSRKPPRKDYRGVTTAVAGVPPRPRTPAMPPLMAGRSTPPPAAAYFQMSPYGGGIREPDEKMPLTYIDLARGGHLAALSRIGEEEDNGYDSAGEGPGGGSVDDDSNCQKKGDRLSKASKLSFDDGPEKIQLDGTSRGQSLGETSSSSTGSGVGAISTAGNSVDMAGELVKGDSGLEEMPGSPIWVDEERPLWQQNRQRNRSLMRQ